MHIPLKHPPYTIACIILHIAFNGTATKMTHNVVVIIGGCVGVGNGVLLVVTATVCMQNKVKT